MSQNHWHMAKPIEDPDGPDHGSFVVIDCHDDAPVAGPHKVRQHAADEAGWLNDALDLAREEAA